MPKAMFLRTLLMTPAILLAACAPATPMQLAVTATHVPGTEPTLRPAGATPAAPPTPAGYVTYESQLLGIQFRYPASWHLQERSETTTLTSFDPSNPPHKLEWTDQTISIQFEIRVLPEPYDAFDAWVKSVRQEAMAQHLEVAAEEHFQIAGQPAARLTLFSGSGGIIDRVLTVLDGRYFVIDIEGNYALATDVLASIEPFASGGG